MKTAVEWFYDKVIQKIYRDIDYSLENLLNLAKEIFEQQIIDACNQEEFFGSYGYGICGDLTKGEQYYNETFKKD